MRSCLLPLFRQQAQECACALANCAEVNRGLASCCLGNDSDGNWEPGGKDWEQPAGGFEEQRGRLWLPLWILPWTARRVRSALHTGLSLFPTLTFAILLEHSASIKYTTNTFICSLATAAFSFPGKVVNWSLLTPAIHQPAAGKKITRLLIMILVRTRLNKEVLGRQNGGPAEERKSDLTLTQVQDSKDLWNKSIRITQSISLEINQNAAPPSEMRSTNKLEKSRQSARECRARKKLRYQVGVVRISLWLSFFVMIIIMIKRRQSCSFHAVLGRHDPWEGEGERRLERGTHQICRMVSDAWPEPGEHFHFPITFKYVEGCFITCYNSTCTGSFDKATKDPVSGTRGIARVAYHHPRIMEVRKWSELKYHNNCQRIQSVCDEK